MKSIVAIAPLLVLSACATTGDKAVEQVQAGNFQAAKILSQKAISNGENPGQNWFILGYAYERTSDPQRAIRCYTMSARYGYAKSQLILSNNKLPVPPADLARSNNADAELAAAALIGALNYAGKGNYANQTTPAPQPQRPLFIETPSVTCKSTKIGIYTTTKCD